MHSSEYLYPCIAKGQNAIVVGAGCSGHDIAQDLTTKGARVTLVQRSPTAVVSRKAMARSFRGTPLSSTNQHPIDHLAGYFAPDILPIDVADRFYLSIPFKATMSSKNEITSTNSDIDKYVASTRHVLTDPQPCPIGVFATAWLTAGISFLDRTTTS